MTAISLQANALGPEGAKALAPVIRDSTSITVIDLRYNSLDTESATMLANIAKEKKISLCGITPDQSVADFTPGARGARDWGPFMGPGDAILLTADLAVRASLTSIILRWNDIGEEGEASLRKAVEGRSGFKLLL